MPEMAHDWLNKVFYSILFYSIHVFIYKCFVISEISVTILCPVWHQSAHVYNFFIIHIIVICITYHFPAIIAPERQ